MTTENYAAVAKPATFDWTVVSPENFSRDPSEMITKDGRFRMKNIGTDLIRWLAPANGWDEAAVQAHCEAFIQLNNGPMTQELSTLLAQYDQINGASSVAQAAPVEQETPPAPPADNPPAQPEVVPERKPRRGRPPSAAVAAAAAAAPVPAPAPTPAPNGVPTFQLEDFRSVIREAINESLKPIAAEIAKLNTMCTAVLESKATESRVESLDNIIRILTMVNLNLAENVLQAPQDAVFKTATADASKIDGMLQALKGKAKG